MGRMAAIGAGRHVNNSGGLIDLSDGPGDDGVAGENGKTEGQEKSRPSHGNGESMLGDRRFDVHHERVRIEFTS